MNSSLQAAVRPLFVYTHKETYMGVLRFGASSPYLVHYLLFYSGVYVFLLRSFSAQEVLEPVL